MSVSSQKPGVMTSSAISLPFLIDQYLQLDEIQQLLKTLEKKDHFSGGGGKE